MDVLSSTVRPGSRRWKLSIRCWRAFRGSLENSFGLGALNAAAPTAEKGKKGKERERHGRGGHHAEAFEGSTRYDALNRPAQSIAPHSSLARAKRNVIQHVFNEANLLERVDVWLERSTEPATLNNDAPSPVGVANIGYDAKGQRQRIDYRNGVSTFYDYDPLTFRLIRLYTRRGARTGCRSFASAPV